MLWFCQFITIVVSLCIDFTPRELIEEFDHYELRVIFASFSVEPTCLATVAALLLYREYNFGLHYFQRDSLQRQQELLKYVGLTELHETIFDIQKLFRNELLASYIFRHENIHYEGEIMKDFLDWGSAEQFSANRELCHAVLEYASTNQVNQITSLKFLIRYVSFAVKGDLEWLCQMLADQMFPEMLAVLLAGSENDPSHWLQKSFLLDDENDNVLFLRVLTLSAAIVNISDSPWTVESLTPTTIKERLRIDKSIEVISVEMIRQLSSKSDILDSPAYWGTLASLLTRSLAIFEQNEWILISRKVVKSGNLCRAIVKRLFEDLLEIDPGSADLLVQLSVSHPSITIRSLDDRRSQWLRSGVLAIPGDRHVVLPADSEPYFLDLLTRNHTCGHLPLGLQLWHNTADVSITQSRAFIDSAIDLLTKKAPDLSRLELTLVFISWLYLIEEHRKMDISYFFPDGNADKDWNLFSFRVGKQDMDNVAFIFGMLSTLKISKFFRPIDIRSLIDSSWHGQSSSLDQEKT